MSAHHILLIEDDSTEAKLAQHTLHRIDPDLVVTHLSNGEEFLDYVRTQSVDDVSLAIMDLHMPRRGGIETLQQLADDHQRPPFPILMFTSSDHPDDVRRVYELGASAYVTKPSTNAEYRVALQHIVNFWLSTNRLC